jgi:radical SAM protein with 4Fe4S-binding SPASM domain
MDKLNYGSFSASFQQRVGNTRLPISGTIELTRRCPLTCVHCYNNLPMTDADARAREMSTADHHRLLDQLSDAGCLWLLYTGGEILARRDFFDIYTYAKRKGFLVTLFTNGTMITEAVADKLAEWRPFAIEITLYGYTKETYERMTGIPGSHDRCMRGIRLLLERDLALSLKTVAVSHTRHELDDMRRFAEDDLGVEFKFDVEINPRLDCSQSPLNVRLSPEEAVALDLEHPRRRDEWVKYADELHTATMPPVDEVYQCGGGVNSFSVDAYGRLSICVLSEAHKYDLRRGSFADGWNGFLLQQRLKKVSRPTKCVGCEMKSMCGMCPATAELENGDPETPVDYLCRVAHLRAMTIGIPIQPHGDCEYCEGGVGHAPLAESARRLRENSHAFVRHDTAVARDGKVFLNVVNAAPAATSCGSCGVR